LASISRKDAWDVLQQHELGSHLADESEGIGPEVTLISLSSSLAGGAMGLTRETCRNEAHHSSALVTIEGTYIGPDWGVIEGAIAHPLLDKRLAPGFTFNISYRPCCNAR
jgi:hypothetical protein